MSERDSGDKSNPKEIKISPDFTARVDGLKPKEKIYVVILLDTIDTSSVEKSATQRLSFEERQATLKAMQKVAEQGLDDIDDILERSGGKRIPESSGELGSILVETTAAGIKSLIASDWVKTIYEDQDAHLIKELSKSN